MKVLTYTNIWSTERKIYAFGDISLPAPVSFKQIGLFLLIGAPWFLIMGILHVPFVSDNPFPMMLWIGPPLLLAMAGNKKVLEDKSVFEFLSSQIAFLMEPKKIYDQESDPTIDKTFTVEAKIWQKRNKEHL
jgi:hypothetical protein